MNIEKLVSLCVAMIAMGTFAAPVIETVGTWSDGTYEGKSYDIAVDGDYAYVADGPGGLVVLDVSDPSAPVRSTVL